MEKESRKKVYDRLNENFLQRWMTYLAPWIADKRLVDCLMPGSHDANTYSISAAHPAGGFCRCQLFPVSRQLQLGSRFLDLRYGVVKATGDVVYDFHGPIRGGKFVENLHQIKHFLQDNFSEFVVVYLQPENQLPSEAKRRLVDDFDQIFGELLVRLEDVQTWFDVSTVTLGQIWKTRRRLLVLSSDGLFVSGEMEQAQVRRKGIQRSRDHCVNIWHDVNHVDQLLAKNVAAVQERDRGKLWVAQVVLTPESEVSAYVRHFFKGTLPTISSLVRRLFKGSRVQRFLIENIARQFNVFLFDYIHHDVQLLQYIVSQNAGVPLQILAAYAGIVDITAVVRTHQGAGNSLYIPSLKDFRETYGLDRSELVLIYRYGSSKILFSHVAPSED